jgi:hypothetical protein
MALAITRNDLSGRRPARLAARRSKAPSSALALALEDASRTAAARAAGMDRQPLRDWVRGYDVPRKRKSRPRRDGGRGDAAFYSAYFNALASRAALLPLLGATIADLISLRAVFALAIAAAVIQLGLLRKLRTPSEI